MSDERPTNIVLQQLGAQEQYLLNAVETTKKMLESQQAQVAATERTLAYYQQRLEQVVDAIAIITHGPSALEAVAHDLRSITNRYELEWNLETALTDIILNLEDGSYLA